MGRMRNVLAAVGVLLALLGAGTAVALRSDEGPRHAVPTTEVQASTGSNPAGGTSLAQPSAEEIQKVIAGLTSQILAPADPTTGTTPITKEQVEAQLRERLKQLGITY